MWVETLCTLVFMVGSTLAMSDQEAAMFHNDGSQGGSVSVTSRNRGRTQAHYFYSNGIPDHQWQKTNPHDVGAQSYRRMLAKSPTKTQTPGCLRQGPVGFALNGVPFFNPLTRPLTHLYKNAVEGGTAERFDSCDGHPAPGDAYHYHKLPENCVYQGTADELVGVANDGFPIYGPLASAENRELTSDDLDECHGREEKGQYRYRITRDFPYILGCYKGQLLGRGGQYTCQDAGKGVLCSCEAGTVGKSNVTTYARRMLREARASGRSPDGEQDFLANLRRFLKGELESL